MFCSDETNIELFGMNARYHVRRYQCIAHRLANWFKTCSGLQTEAMARLSAGQQPERTVKRSKQWRQDVSVNVVVSLTFEP